MGRVSKTTQALYNGVSQQPAGLRLDSQVEEMVNMWPDVARGVTRRSPSAYISKPSFLLPAGWDETAEHQRTFTHKIDKNLDERYIVNFTTDAAVTPTTEIHITDLTGAELPVVYDTTAAQDYIESAPNSHGAGGLLRAVSVLDTTFVVNTSVTPAMTSALSQFGQSLLNSNFKWTNSVTNANEWYCELAGGGDPNLARPEEILEDNTEIPEGTLGALAVGEWAYGDNDAAITFDTVYIRLTDDADPNGKAEDFVFMKNTQDFAYINATGGANNSISLEINGSKATAAIGSAYGASNTIAAFSTAATALAATGVKAVTTGPSSGACLRLTVDNAGVNEDFNAKISTFSYVDLIKGKVDKFTDLPAQGLEGDILEVTGEAAESNSSSYYVRYEEATSRWIETIPDGLSYEIDATTMPHKMTRQVDTGGAYGPVGGFYFFVEAIDWTDRAVGDDSSNPLPSFIGTPIEDIFFYQNRLGFASGENIIMSQTKEYFNFFAQTTTDSLDDDPIDVTIGTNSAVTVKWVFPFTNSLELIGTNKQFSLHSGTNSPALTPSNVVVDPTTSLEPAPDVRPAEMGNALYIAVESGIYVNIFRYQVDPEGINSNAFDITRHVPEYIKEVDKLSTGPDRHVSQIIANQDTSSLFVVSAGVVNNDHDELDDWMNPRSTLYVYTSFEQGGELVQSAWHRWTLPVRAGASFGDDLYLFTARALNLSSTNDTDLAEILFESIPLDPSGAGEDIIGVLGFKAAGPLFLDCLQNPSDNRLDAAGGFIAEIPWFEPSQISDTCSMAVVTIYEDNYDAGGKYFLTNPTRSHDNSIPASPRTNLTFANAGWTAPLTAVLYYVGYQYCSYIRLSEVTVTKEGGGGSLGGRLVHLSDQVFFDEEDEVKIQVRSLTRPLPEAATVLADTADPTSGVLLASGLLTLDSLDLSEFTEGTISIYFKVDKDATISTDDLMPTSDSEFSVQLFPDVYLGDDITGIQINKYPTGGGTRQYRFGTLSAATSPQVNPEDGVLHSLVITHDGTNITTATLDGLDMPLSPNGSNDPTPHQFLQDLLGSEVAFQAEGYALACVSIENATNGASIHLPLNEAKDTVTNAYVTDSLGATSTVPLTITPLSGRDIRWTTLDAPKERLFSNKEYSQFPSSYQAYLKGKLGVHLKSRDADVRFISVGPSPLTVRGRNWTGNYINHSRTL